MKITARGVPYSSVVGAGVLLADETGAVVAQLAMLNVAGGREEAEAMRDRVVAAINAGGAGEQVRHFKTGATYDVVDAHALFQVSAPSMGDGKEPFKPRCRVVEDGAPVTVYRNPEGMHFVRFPDEMVSPRFEKVEP